MAALTDECRFAFDAAAFAQRCTVERVAELEPLFPKRDR